MLIKTVKMSGFRTIKNLAVDFGPGLNIIIGDNGSGKTNFREFLTDALIVKNTLSYEQFSCQIFFDNDIYLTLVNQPIENPLKIVEVPDFLKWTLKLKDGQEIGIRDYEEIWSKVGENIKRYYVHSVPHGYPPTVQLLNVPFNGAIELKDADSHFLKIMELLATNPTNAYEGWFATYVKIGLALLDVNDSKVLWKDFLDKMCAFLNKYLVKCTAIKEIRLSDSFNVDFSSEKKLSVTNLFFEFYQNDRWNNYQELSDGTKRLFTILICLLDFKKFVENCLSKDLGSKLDDTIVFIEEPELGIHPHQLYKLMLVLKEEAQAKQIILTTHSPVVLDVLERNELSSIIICSYDKENGTQLKHLTDKEREKAIGYMDKIGYLSLYWTHSNLEKLSI
jgi:predicted ATP-dependent endonuclease of OLD family